MFIFLYFYSFEVLHNEGGFAFFCGREIVKDIGERRITWKKSSSLFKSCQSQSFLIYSQSKVKAKLIYIQILLFAIEFCHLRHPVCYHPYGVCKTVSVFLYFGCLQCRLVLASCLWCLSCVWAFGICTIW